MLGYILLGFAIYYYFYAGMKKWSILIFMFFCNNGFQILPDFVIGAKNYDLAAIFCFFMAPFSMIYEDAPERENKTIKYLVVFMMYFMIVSAFFSRYHYDFTWFQIFQGGRRLIIFVSYFFIVKMKKKDIEWLFNILFKITMITSVLYIIQVVTDLPVLPHLKGDKIAELGAELGTYGRYYNSPPLLYLFLFISIFHPELLKIKRPYISVMIFAAALLCTLGRVQITSVIFMTIIGFLMRGRLTVFVKYALVFSLALIPLSDSISMRFSGEDYGSNSATEEIKNIMNGSVQETVLTGDIKGKGTMNYRLAWIFERMLYLSERPIGEKIFGLGMISDSQIETVQRMYNFRVGREQTEDSNAIGQLSTPDTSYGNLLSKFGYVGGTVFFILWVTIMIYGWKNRKKDEWMFILFLITADMIILSFSGDVISNPKYLSILYLIITLSLFRQTEKQEDNPILAESESNLDSLPDNSTSSSENIANTTATDENHSH